MAVNGHLPAWRERGDVDDRRGRRRPSGPLEAFAAAFPNARWYDDRRGPARDRATRLRRRLHAALDARGARAHGARQLRPRPLREAARDDSRRAARAARARRREGAHALHGAQLEVRARDPADRRARPFGRARRGPPLPLGDAARQARRRGRRRRQLARRSGPVGRRHPRRPRLARALRRAGLDADDAAHGRGAPLDAQAPPVADRGHGGPDALPPGGLRRDLPDLGRRRARQPRRAARARAASSSSTAAG